MANMPSRLVMTKSGCFLIPVNDEIQASDDDRTSYLILMVKAPTYEAMCSQNTPRKNSLNESNISMKKYHHSPMFGVRSTTSS